MCNHYTVMWFSYFYDIHQSESALILENDDEDARLWGEVLLSLYPLILEGKKPGMTPPIFIRFSGVNIFQVWIFF